VSDGTSGSDLSKTDGAPPSDGDHRAERPARLAVSQNRTWGPAARFSQLIDRIPCSLLPQRLALNNLYHPDNQPGVAAAARNGAFSVLQDMGFDVLREFWPEVARKLNLPFRGVREE